MVSYRTLIFGTIAVISASAPAVASGLSALPGPQQAVVSSQGLSALPAKTKPQTVKQSSSENVVTLVLQRLGQLERQILQPAPLKRRSVSREHDLNHRSNYSGIEMRAAVPFEFFHRHGRR